MTDICCRFCNAVLRRTFVDLGKSPLANSFLSPDGLRRPETFYPLKVFICDRCLLAQLPEHESAANIFSDYIYFSSYSQSWLEHCRAYAGKMVERFDLGPSSRVVEIASNDGYLLQYFKERGVGILGVEPAGNVAQVAIAKGIPTEVAFFGRETAERLAAAQQRADLMAANNVLAHVPDINDFVAGFKILLKPSGTATFEFPHLLRLIEGNQFDTIYHEHFSYLSLLAVDRIFSAHGLRIYDVEQLSTHGGSLRIFVELAERNSARGRGYDDVLAAEKAAGLDRIETYDRFGEVVTAIKCDLMSFLIDARRAGKTVAGYGAAAKGNTLLNYCGIKPDLLSYVVDANPHKQGHFLPGSQIPVYAPDRIFETRPDYVLILPWNLKEEIMGVLARIREYGGAFVVAVPRLEVIR